MSVFKAELHLNNTNKYTSFKFARLFTRTNKQVKRSIKKIQAKNENEDKTVNELHTK